MRDFIDNIEQYQITDKFGDITIANIVDSNAKFSIMIQGDTLNWEMYKPICMAACMMKKDGIVINLHIICSEYIRKNIDSYVAKLELGSSTVIRDLYAIENGNEVEGEEIDTEPKEAIEYVYAATFVASDVVPSALYYKDLNSIVENDFYRLKKILTGLAVNEGCNED